MAFERNYSASNILAPPPSPIPTAAGSRSAADYFLSEYLENSLNVPSLALPDSQILPTQRIDKNRVPDHIDLQSLISRSSQSLNRILEAAREIGVFRIQAHGIGEEELLMLENEGKKVFEILENRDTGRGINSGGPNDNKEEIVWVRSDLELMDRARKYIGPELFLSFSEKMGCVGSKLDTIADEVRKVLVESLGSKQYVKRSNRENILSIIKFNHHVMDQHDSNPIQEKHKNSLDHLFGLHLPTKLCRFYVQSQQGVFSFVAGPGSIIVTIGKQLEEWSLGDYKCVFGEIMRQPALEADFSIELRCPCPALTMKPGFVQRNKKFLSITDQILIGVFLCLSYHILDLLWSRFC